MSMFRETLVRELGGSRTLCVGMQNPSKAQAHDGGRNDPTIHRLVGFAPRLGFGRLVVVNTYMLVEPDQKALYRWINSLSLWDRRAHRMKALEIAIREAKAADMFIAAYGNGHPDDKWPREFVGRIAAAGVNVHVFGRNQNGTPKHPMARGRNRIPDDAQPVLWLAAGTSIAA
jgi:hypothetical protein